jgi:hypothetical protein
VEAGAAEEEREEAWFESGFFKDAPLEAASTLSLVLPSGAWSIGADAVEEPPPETFEKVIVADGAGDPGAFGGIVSGCFLMGFDAGF